MRKALFVAAVAAALSAVAPSAAGAAVNTAATTDPSATPSGSASATPSTPGDQLVGLGTLGDFGTPTAYLGAVSTARWGTTGAFTITYPDGTYAIGRSTCLVVNGKVAYLTGRIDLSGGPRRTTNAWGKGNYLVVGVEDNGNGGAQESPDRLNFSPGTATDPGCGPNGMATPDFKIVRGNYRIADGAA